MNPRLLILALGKIVGFPSRVKLYLFDAACRNPQIVQERLLRSILDYHKGTAFGRDHGFAGIRTVADYRRHVSVAGYDRLEPYIARVRAGETNALLADREVLMFALTSGTTATRKTIPVTPRYLADYRRGWNRWGLRAMFDHQSISCAPILQMAGDMAEYRTEAGIPCGSLSGLTAAAQKRFIKFLYCFPEAACALKDASARYYVSLLFSLYRPVGMLIAANPSTLVGLARALDEFKEPLLRDLHDGTLSLDVPADVRAALARRLKPRPARAKQLDAIAAKAGRLLPRDVWPPNRLLIGCWTGGSVGPYLRQLDEYYGPCYRRDLGLVASEGRMTIPLHNGTPAGPLDITTHYYEFVPEREAESANPVVLGAHELEDGGRYFLVPTTAAGLYRYDLRDLVWVRGFHGRTPMVEFLSKGSHFSSLTGEKLSEYQVTAAVDGATARLGVPLPVYVVAPVWDEAAPYYGLFAERGGFDARLLAAIDRDLMMLNDEYASKRKSGRLGALHGFVLPVGTWKAWDAERRAKAGGTLEQYKHPCLLPDLGLRERLPVEAELSALAAA